MKSEEDKVSVSSQDYSHSRDSLFIDAEGEPDLTIRPARFKRHPRAWPEGMPIPKAEELNGQEGQGKPGQPNESDKG